LLGWWGPDASADGAGEVVAVVGDEVVVMRAEPVEVVEGGDVGRGPPAVQMMDLQVTPGMWEVDPGRGVRRRRVSMSMWTNTFVAARDAPFGTTGPPDVLSAWAARAMSRTASAAYASVGSCSPARRPASNRAWVNGASRASTSATTSWR
jgi:hypothetical protein